MKIAILLVFFMVALGDKNNVSAEEVIVIVNPINEKDMLSKEEIREIYLGKMTFWKNNTKIIPVNRTEEEIMNKFTNSVISISSELFKTYWIKKLFQFGVIPPIQKNNSKEIINLVNSDKGAIGYIYRKELDEKAGVKVVYAFN